MGFLSRFHKPITIIAEGYATCNFSIEEWADNMLCTTATSHIHKGDFVTLYSNNTVEYTDAYNYTYTIGEYGLYSSPQAIMRYLK